METKNNQEKMSKENIVELYQKKILNGNNWLILGAINIIHFIFLIIFFIPLFYYNENLNIGIIHIMLFAFAHRLFLNGECFIFYIEKKLIDPDYEAGDNNLIPGWNYIANKLNLSIYKSNFNSRKIYLISTYFIALSIFTFIVLRTIKSNRDKLLYILLFWFILSLNFILFTYSY